MSEKKNISKIFKKYMGFIAVYKIWLSVVVFTQLTKTEKHEKLETCFFPSSGFVRVGQYGWVAQSMNYK